jgi:hypothetical protein
VIGGAGKGEPGRKLSLLALAHHSSVPAWRHGVRILFGDVEGESAHELGGKMLKALLGLLHGKLGLVRAAVWLSVGAAAVVVFGGLVAGSLAASVPQPAGNNSLSGVSCVSPEDCWAVGWTVDTASYEVVGETLHWNGSSWLAVSSPAVVGPLDSVSCVSSSDCWAVGNTGNGAPLPQPLTVRWNGFNWTTMPVPSGSGAALGSVSCTSSANCWAVGSDDYGNETLALRWTGSMWVRVATPSPDKFDKALTALTCISARNCWAFGYYDGPPVGTFVTASLMAVHWNGSGWKRVWTSAPYYGAEVSPAAAIAGISCASSRHCLAVGWSSILGGATRSLALQWNGSRWAPVKTPKIHEAYLYGVDCTAANDCWAVGSTAGLVGSSHSLALRWNGSSWTQATPPGDPSSVSCTSSSRCWAVGSTESNGRSRNLALRWNGSIWSSG